jgi:hypothetical protein
MFVIKGTPILKSIMFLPGWLAAPDMKSEA